MRSKKHQFFSHSQKFIQLYKRFKKPFTSTLQFKRSWPWGLLFSQNYGVTQLDSCLQLLVQSFIAYLLRRSSRVSIDLCRNGFSTD